jgi:adenosylmethionine-8-amino-7-oxononanoate aminotransferase
MNSEGTDRLSNIDKKYIWHPFTQMKDYLTEDNIIIEKGEGVYLIDTDGNRYIDGVSSMWTNIFGHKKRQIDDAIKDQLGRIAHSTLLGLANVPSTLLAKRLINIVPKGLTKVFYSDNGSTAVEVALKTAFLYCMHKGRKDKTKFIALKNAYHGDTLGAVSVGGVSLFHSMFKPLLTDVIFAPSPYCYRCGFDKKPDDCGIHCATALEEIAKRHCSEVAALIIEPIVQAAGGMITAPAGYLKKVREICTKYGILMIADEVAVGFGRTGMMFGCDNERVTPDIMAIAKGLSAGYMPFAATLMTDEVYDAFLGEYSEFKTLFHGHTFTGNQLGASIALAVLELFEKEEVLKNLKPKIDYLSELLDRFKGHKHVGDIRQRGFIAALELVKDKETKEDFPLEDKIGIKAIKHAAKLGLIIRPLGNVIVIMPPYVITKDELKKMIDIIEESIDKAISK